MSEQDNKCEVQINSTLDQILELKDSIIWQDICRELNIWAELFDRESKAIVEDAAKTNPSTANVLLHLGDINGRLKAVNYMTGILDVFIDILNEQKDSEQQSLNLEEND